CAGWLPARRRPPAPPWRRAAHHSISPTPPRPNDVPCRRPGSDAAVKTDVEELGPTRVKLSIEVPFEELKPSLDKAYREVARQVRIPGFRPGKGPPRIIAQRLGRGVVLEQAVNDALPGLYGKALEEGDVLALGQPELEITKLDD